MSDWNETEARTQAAGLYRELGRHGLCPGRAGNVSLRTPHGMIVTPSGAAPEEVKAEDIVAIALDGHPLGAGVPSSEWLMHARIYQAFPQARCVVHTHAEACSALACLRERLPPFHYMVLAFGGEDVRCTPYVTFGTPALAEAAVRALQDRTACLLANHGMNLHAAEASQALAAALVLESLARQYLLARTAGTPHLLTADEVREARERFRSYDAGLG